MIGQSVELYGNWRLCRLVGTSEIDGPKSTNGIHQPRAIDVCKTNDLHLCYTVSPIGAHRSK